jgi:hypothetical protein
MTSSTWKRFHGEVKNWAIRAIDEWIASLSKEGRTFPQRSPETMVVLFGPTQVGKTTLLLTLLGIAEGEAFAAVQTVLRGNRQHGASSTATPMRYARSLDNLWRLGKQDGPGLSADDMQAQLAEIRRQVEDGSWQSTEPISLFIPAYHFAESEPSVRVAILDLPGIAAANPRERALVEKIAQRHVPAASLILLVSTANRLGVFEPEKLGQELEELKGWVHSPIRYRLVITYAYSQDSVGRWREAALEAGRPCDLGALRSFFNQEIAHFELKMPDDLPNRIYPLELGDSWNGMAQKGGEHYRWSASVQSTVREALTKDIRQSCEGERRLRISKEVREQAYWRQKDLWQQWRKNRDRLRVEAKNCATDAAALRGRKGKWDKRLQRYHTRLAALNEVASSIKSKVGECTPEADAIPTKNTVSSLQKWLVDDQDKLIKACNDVIDGFNKNTGMRVPPMALPPCNEVKNIHRRLTEYSIDGYWTWLSDQFKEDHRTLGRAAKEQRKLIQRTLSDKMHDLLNKQRRYITKRRNIVVKQQKLCDADLAKLDQKQVQIGEEREQLWAEHMRKLRPARHDLEQVAKFEAHMAKAYECEAERLASMVDDAVRIRQPSLALARLCQLRLSRNLYENYFIGDS